MRTALTRNGAVLLALLLAAIPLAADPLPSWNPSASKSAILSFVDRVTTPGTREFVPREKRIATFDNDGTLWAEQPVYFELMFIYDRVRQLEPEHPDWKSREPFASVLRGDLRYPLTAGGKSVRELVMATETGMSSAAFTQLARDWLATARHPQTGRLYTRMVYQPMLELLAFLRARGFKTFVVSGGGQAFMRAWTEPVYGIPPERIIGSTTGTEYQVHDGKPRIFRLPQPGLHTDKGGKPVGIELYIGRRPILAVGNSDGDFEMLEWTTAGEGLRLGMLIHHTDAAREWAYDRDSPVGRLSRALDAAPARGWQVVDMKDDWRVVFDQQ